MQSWVLPVVVLNAMLVTALNFPVIAPPESVPFALISILIAGCGALLGLVGRPPGTVKPPPEILRLLPLLFLVACDGCKGGVLPFQVNQ